MAADSLTIGVDIGGTFTDVAIVTASGDVFTNKAPTTPGDPARGVFAALARAASQLGTDLEGLLARAGRITHGSTIATNALLTRTGATVGLITTRGFEDTPFIMRAIGRVDGLPEEEVRHVATVTKPAPLVLRSRVRGIRERIDVHGNVFVPLRTDDVARALDDLVEREQVEALAVCLLNSWANSAHEERICELIENRYGGDSVYCAYSCRLARVAGEYARMNTALVDAFVGPKVQRYLRNLDEELRQRGFQGRFMLMQGNGGLTSREQCTPVATVQSGPAGGMLATSYMAKIMGHDHVLSADMGGTSFDVGMYVDGYWRYAEEPIFNRFRILQPIIEIESIGAGGGTIAHPEETTGRLIVGPQSAGADPGPACYGVGGTEATVTDANVVLGIIDPDYFLGGVQRLDAGYAHQAIGDRVAKPLGLAPVEAAAGIHQITNGKMADLIRRQVIRSGYLPEEFVLYAYGGAAAVHAVGFARDLGIRTIYVFPTSPVFSAFGIAQADVRHTRVMTCRYLLPDDGPECLNEPLGRLEEELFEIMMQEGFRREVVALHRYASLRFRRQAVGVEIELPWDRANSERVGELISLFDRKYEELYGRGAGNVAAGIEVNGLRVDAVGQVPKPVLRPNVEEAVHAPVPKAYRRVYLDGDFKETPVYEWGELRPAHHIRGPGVIESQFTTVLVLPGTAAHLDPFGNVVLTLTGGTVHGTHHQHD